MFAPRPSVKATSLVRGSGDRLIVRLRSASGEQMATHLRPMTLQDTFRRQFFRRGA